MTTSNRASVWLLALLALAGCGETDPGFELGGRYYDRAGLTRWALPRELREVSGLALDSAGRLFAHGDEAAMIVELDYRNGRVVRRFGFGNPPARGDFEGIAWAGQRLFLVTSDGELLEARAAEGQHLEYRRHDTGLGRRCEIEGLDYDPERRLLLMLCKTARQAALAGRVAMLAWSLDNLAVAPEHDLIAPAPGAGKLSTRLAPSGLTRSARNGHLILVAARQQAVIELTPDGTLVKAFRLPHARAHPQMEGVALSASGDLIIADEGAGRRGFLSVYTPRP